MGVRRMYDEKEAFPRPKELMSVFVFRKAGTLPLPPRAIDGGVNFGKVAKKLGNSKMMNQTTSKLTMCLMRRA